MDVTTSVGPEAERFAAIFSVYSPRVFVYVCRHIDRSMVDDVLSETFLVAWRRLDEIPDEPLPWLLVVARNVLANQRRALGRRTRQLIDTTALDRLVSTDAAVEDVVIARVTVLSALGSLTAFDREALLLIAWDGLSAAHAAEVAGCSPQTFGVRLHRARRRLRRAIDTRDDRPGRSLAALLKETP